MRNLKKKIIPAPLWSFIRKRKILKDHAYIGQLCDGYIRSYMKGAEGQYQWTPKKDLQGKKIIWQYWAQGFDPSNLPELVKECLSSVDHYCGEYEVIRLSDENVSEYVDFPEFISKRRNSYSTTAYSDVLRLALLYLYGGCWLDATVYLTGPIEEKYSECDFFMFQRDPEEPNKKYWESSYAYYFGWDKGFKVGVLTSIAFSKPGAKFTKDFLNTLCLVWEQNEQNPFYFMIQILFNELLRLKASSIDCPIVSDCTPHLLMQIVNDEKAPFSIEEALSKCHIHKLTYKNFDIERFHKLIQIDA